VKSFEIALQRPTGLGVKRKSIKSRAYLALYIRVQAAHQLCDFGRNPELDWRLPHVPEQSFRIAHGDLGRSAQ
jgi:hypothetical protein